jgi:hypothetical protein
MRIQWRPFAMYFAWLIGFPLIMLFIFRIGIAIGYATLGGQSLGEGLSTAAWKHVVDLIFQ